jgi:hypothetical protein
MVMGEDRLTVFKLQFEAAPHPSWWAMAGRF